MKAYKSVNDDTDLRLFRPDLNMERLKNSMERLAMPGADFDPKELIKAIGELVRVGKLSFVSLIVFDLLNLSDEL